MVLSQSQWRLEVLAAVALQCLMMTDSTKDPCDHFLELCMTGQSLSEVLCCSGFVACSSFQGENIKETLLEVVVLKL